MEQPYILFLEAKPKKIIVVGVVIIVVVVVHAVVVVIPVADPQNLPLKFG